MIYKKYTDIINNHIDINNFVKKQMLMEKLQCFLLTENEAKVIQELPYFSFKTRRNLIEESGSNDNKNNFKNNENKEFIEELIENYK